MAEDYVFLDSFKPSPFFDWLGIGLFIALLTVVFGLGGFGVALMLLYLFGWD